MEFNLSLPRLLLLAALLAAFAAAGGFVPPAIPPDSMLDPHRVAKAWRYCVILFVVGAFSASLIDHFVGTIDRTNIRLVYLILGIAMMVGSWVWLRGLASAGDRTMGAWTIRPTTDLSLIRPCHPSAVRPTDDVLFDLISD